MIGNKKPPSVVTILARVTPRADRNAVAGLREDGVLLLRTTSPPAEGAANASCTEMLAQLYEVRRSQVTLVSGATGRDKRFSIEGLTPREAEVRLQAVTPLQNGN